MMFALQALLRNGKCSIAVKKRVEPQIAAHNHSIKSKPYLKRPHKNRAYSGKG